MSDAAPPKPPRKPRKSKVIDPSDVGSLTNVETAAEPEPAAEVAAGPVEAAPVYPTVVPAPPQLSAEAKKARSRRNLAIALLLVAFVVLVFIATIVKLGGGGVPH